MQNAPIRLAEITEKNKRNFWRKIAKSDSCWLWTAYRDRAGYGQFYTGGQMRLAHRVAWVLENGEIPTGMDVLHRCDNPPCCNPAHLWLGTNADNMRDMAAKGRDGARRHPEKLRRGDNHPARLHPENLSRGESHYYRTNPECVRRGEASTSAKLNEAQILQIRSLYAAGGISYKRIGELFGVTVCPIRDIVKGRAWKHIYGARTVKDSAYDAHP